MRKHVYKVTGDNGKQFLFAGVRRPSLSEAENFLSKEMDANDVGRFVSIEEADDTAHTDTDAVFGDGKDFSLDDAIIMHMRSTLDMEGSVLTRDVLKAMSDDKGKAAVIIYDFLHTFAYAVKNGIIPRCEMAAAGSAFDKIVPEAETVSVSVTERLVRIIFFDENRHIVKLVIFSAGMTPCGKYILNVPDKDDEVTISVMRAFFRESKKIKENLTEDAMSALIAQVDRMDSEAGEAGREMFGFLGKAGLRSGIVNNS